MPDLADPVPPPPSINPGLSACRENTMLDLFGRPGALAEKCSDVTGPVKDRIRWGVDVGPFKVSGLDFAVESLAQVLSEVAEKSEDAYRELKTAGMLCCRRIKHNPAHYSNHSWGTAIDLYYGTGVLPQGKPLAQRGFLQLYGAFNRHGWFWGAGFTGGAVDSMHFELADETIRGFAGIQLSHDLLVADAEYAHAMGYDKALSPS